MNHAEELWREFEGMTLDRNTPAVRRLEIRLAFVSGLYAGCVRLAQDEPSAPHLMLTMDAQAMLRSAISEYRSLEDRARADPG